MKVEVAMCTHNSLSQPRNTFKTIIKKKLIVVLTEIISEVVLVN